MPLLCVILPKEDKEAIQKMMSSAQHHKTSKKFVFHFFGYPLEHATFLFDLILVLLGIVHASHSWANTACKETRTPETCLFAFIDVVVLFLLFFLEKKAHACAFLFLLLIAQLKTSCLRI